MKLALWSLLTVGGLGFAWTLPQWWPLYLTLALSLLLAGCLWGSDRAIWIGGLVAVGICAMQVPFAEPQRWLYAAMLWTVLAAIAGWRVDSIWPALALCTVPAGYFLLAFGLPARTLAFILTEAGGVAALVLGSGGLYDGLSDRLRGVDAGGALPMGEHRCGPVGEETLP